MKSHPILFKAEMVNAILGGRKTQTRRIITEAQALTPQPYAKGDRLWVKETWATAPEHDGTKPTDLPDGCRIYYRTDPYEMRKNAGKWRPSMFMQERFSRVHLEVEHCHVECLGEISTKDILAEGLDQTVMRELLLPGARKVKVKDCHWIDSEVGPDSFCRECALKRLKKLKAKGDERAELDGGWAVESDSLQTCEGCGVRLDCCLTDYGAEEEFAHFLENGCDLKCADSCYCLLEAVGSQGPWVMPERREGERDRCYQLRVRRFDLMVRACWRVLWDSIHGPKSWDENPLVRVITFKRIAP